MITYTTVVLWPNKGDIRYKYQNWTITFLERVGVCFGTLCFDAASSVCFLSFHEHFVDWSYSEMQCVKFDYIRWCVFECPPINFLNLLRQWPIKMLYFEHVIPVTTGEVNSVLYPELLLWANLMCLPQSLLWLPPCRIFLSLALEGFWLAKIKHELLRLSSAADGPKHRSRVCVISHFVMLTILLWQVKTDPESVVRGNLCLQPTQLTPPGHKCLYWHHTLF